VSAGGASGSIRCFVRPEPVPQPTVEEVARLVEPGEFAGQVAVVLGGSRGLGEVTAKLIAAGGGAVRLSYHRGAEEAGAIVREIEAFGGRASAFAYDLASPAPIDADPVGPVTHLYCFAAPRIRAGAAGAFDADLFSRYVRVFAEGLSDAFYRVLPVAAPDLLLFHPSTIFIDEPEDGFEEYVAAKVAAEAVALGIGRRHPGVRVVNARLPRVATDQAQSLLPVTTVDPVEVMRNELRKLPATR